MNIDKPQISLKNISKKYGNHKILENINLDIYQGDFICISWEKWWWQDNAIKYNRNARRI